MFEREKANQTELRKQNVLLWLKHKLQRRAIKSRSRFWREGDKVSFRCRGKSVETSRNQLDGRL